MQFPNTQSSTATYASTLPAHLNLVKEINSFDPLLATMVQTKADVLAKILPEKLANLSSLIEIFSKEILNKNLGEFEDFKLIDLAHTKVRITLVTLENFPNLADANSIAVSILAKKCLFVEYYSQSLNFIIGKYNSTLDGAKLESYIKVDDLCLKLANLCEMLTDDSLKDHHIAPYSCHHPVSDAVESLIDYWNSYGEDLKKRNLPRSGASFTHISNQTKNTIENAFRKLATFQNENAFKAFDILEGCRSVWTVEVLSEIKGECRTTLQGAQYAYQLEWQRKDKEENQSMLAQKGQKIYPFQNLNEGQRTNAFVALKTIDKYNAKDILKELDENPLKFAEKTKPQLLRIAANKISELHSQACSGQGYQGGMYADPEDVRANRRIRCESEISEIEKALKLINADFKTSSWFF